MANDRDDPRFFPPQVALYLVKIACERPDMMERSLSQWDCTELARSQKRGTALCPTNRLCL